MAPPKTLDDLLEELISAHIQVLQADAKALGNLWDLYKQNEAVTQDQVQTALSQTSATTAALRFKVDAISTTPPATP